MNVLYSCVRNVYNVHCAHNIKQTKLYYKSFMINDDDGRLVKPKGAIVKNKKNREKSIYLHNNSLHCFFFFFFA